MTSNIVYSHSVYVVGSPTIHRPSFRVVAISTVYGTTYIALLRGIPQHHAQSSHVLVVVMRYPALNRGIMDLWPLSVCPVPDSESRREGRKF